MLKTGVTSESIHTVLVLQECTQICTISYHQAMILYSPDHMPPFLQYLGSKVGSGVSMHKHEELAHLNKLVTTLFTARRYFYQPVLPVQQNVLRTAECSPMCSLEDENYTELCLK